jgi:hypothetical protein
VWETNDFDKGQGDPQLCKVTVTATSFIITDQGDDITYKWNNETSRFEDVTDPAYYAEVTGGDNNNGYYISTGEPVEGHLTPEP